MKEIITKILNIIKIIILVILVLFVIATAYQKLIPNNPNVFGYRTFSIITNSMKPKLKKGDVILVKEQAIESYKIGDIVTYQGMDGDMAGKIITHEIVGIAKENGVMIFYTKGSQNITNDPAVYEQQILGKYIYKFKIFSIVERIMDSKLGFILIIAIPLIFIYFYEIRDLVKDIKHIKNQ